ncbi:hypothetical protein LINPERPRIM_LOCUS10924 [Linum perenne]
MSAQDEEDSSSCDEESDNENCVSQVSDKNSGHWTLPIIDGDGVVTPTSVKTRELGKYLTGQKKVYITFNGGYSPLVGDTSRFLGQFIGRMGRDHKMYPIPYKDWRHMSKKIKDRGWKTLFMTQIHVDDNEIEAVRRYVELVLGERWKKHKLYLYKTYFTKRPLPDEEKRQRPPEGVTLRDWVNFLDLMDTDETKVKNGEPPSRCDVFIAMHKGLDGKYKSDEAKGVGERIEEIQALGLAPRHIAPDDAYALALDKPEHPGRIRGLGYEAVTSKASLYNTYKDE